MNSSQSCNLRWQAFNPPLSPSFSRQKSLTATNPGLLPPLICIASLIGFWITYEIHLWHISKSVSIGGKAHPSYGRNHESKTKWGENELTTTAQHSLLRECGHNGSSHAFLDYDGLCPLKPRDKTQPFLCCFFWLLSCHGSAEVTNTTRFAHSLCKGESLPDWVFVHHTEAEYISGSIPPWSSMWKPGHWGPVRATQRLLRAFTSLSLPPHFLYKNQLEDLVEMLPVSWSAWVLGIHILRRAQRLHTHRSHHWWQWLQITQFSWVGVELRVKSRQQALQPPFSNWSKKKAPIRAPAMEKQKQLFKYVAFWGHSWDPRRNPKQKLG